VTDANAGGDVELMIRLRDGDQEAFDELYRMYERPLVNFFYRLCWDRDAAEDLMQETFLRLWRSAPRYTPSGKFSTFLFQIAKNHFLTQKDRLTRERTKLSIDSSREEEDGTSGGIELASSTQAPDAGLRDRELQSRIRKAIGLLGEKHRMVFVLAQYHGMKYQEISEVLDIPVGTVKSRMSYAERALRESLADYLGGDAIALKGSKTEGGRDRNDSSGEDADS
jgi:RNA polymerase sigma-70 factor (ECF subfamily)